MPDKKILLVDDDLDILGILSATLKAKDRTFITASDGVEAVEKVFTEMPDMVLLDVMMPKMNGYQVCRLLKNDKLTWHIPVIMLTARDKDRDRFYGTSVGADDYIVKPFHPQEIRQKVEALLGKAGEVKKACPLSTPVRTNESNLLTKVNSLLDRKLMEMTFLQHMTKAIVSTFDEEKILETILSGVTSYLGYRRVMVFMMEESGAVIERLCTGFPKHGEKAVLDLKDPDAYHRLLIKKEPVVLSGKASIIALPGAKAVEDEDGEQQGIVPIVSREEVRGMVLLERQAGEPPFSEERLSVLSTLASQLGLALDNARLYRKTLHLSITDGLTGLYNARYFYERLEVEMSRARRYKHELTLFMLDLDFFKRYNDTYGHLVGDEALKHLAGILKENTRETDTVARYGGEEFCVLLPETEPEKALVLAERIRKAVEVAGFYTGAGKAPDSLTVSVGVATFTDEILEAEELVRMADKALYCAKESGRNKVCAFS